MNPISFQQLHDELRGGLKAGHVILDVREPDEYQAGHIPGSLNFPLSTIETKVDQIRKLGTVYIHCKAGGRARKAAAFLHAQGLRNLVCVADGGFDAWQASGFPVTK